MERFLLPTLRMSFEDKEDGTIDFSSPQRLAVFNNCCCCCLCCCCCCCCCCWSILFQLCRRNNRSSGEQRLLALCLWLRLDGENKDSPVSLDINWKFPTGETGVVGNDELLDGSVAIVTFSTELLVLLLAFRFKKRFFTIFGLLFHSPM